VISEDKVREIRDRTDIVALVGEYVRLKRAGASSKGLCPFHSEKSPSFTVSPSRQFFHCFGCGASGDVVTFVMKLEGRSFPEALRHLAERAGVELPTLSAAEAGAERGEKEKRARLTAALEAASIYYSECLERHPLGRMARDELSKRAVELDTARAFRIGYAPSGWDGLIGYLGKEGVSLDDAEEVGLVVRRRSGDGYYDRFRHRLMFSIQDVHGRVIAFSGRILPPPPGEEPAKEGEAAAKYVNSPEHPLYKKGDTLFGLHQARVSLRRRGEAILCEGNFDLVALHQAGYDYTLAPLGTAFTASQAKLLRRFAERVTLLFDGDAAGAKAVLSAHPILREAGLVARVVTLPRGADPDSFLREHGKEALEQLLASAPGIVDHLIDTAVDEAGADPPAKAAGIRKLGPILGALDNRVEARLYVERIAQRFGVPDIGAVRELLIKGVREQGRQQPRDREVPVPDERPDPAPEAPRRGAPESLEGELLGALLDAPALFERPISAALFDVLTSDESRAIFSASRASVRDGRIDASTLVQLLGGHPWRTWVEARLAEEKYGTEAAEAALEDGLPRLRFFRLQSELGAVKKRALDATRRGESAVATTLRQRINELHSELAALQSMKR
jgi:DNA primase